MMRGGEAASRAHQDSLGHCEKPSLARREARQSLCDMLHDMCHKDMRRYTMTPIKKFQTTPKSPGVACGMAR